MRELRSGRFAFIEMLRILLLLSLSVSLLWPADDFDRPRSFAIRNARIVSLAGPTIESGVIVLSGGLVAAIGESAPIPPGAWTIEGEGFTVYPGFIDAMSRLGMPEDKAKPGSGPHSDGPEDRPATSTWTLALDSFEAKTDDVEAWRQAGFTSLALAPRAGIFPGQISLLNLGDGPIGERTIAPRAGLVVQLPERQQGYRGYPGSLLGRIAYVKQVFFDAQHYQETNAIYARDPVGLERPPFDRALEPVVETLERKRPVLYPANTTIEIRRALRQQDLLSAALTVYGAQQTYENGVAAELAAAGARVLVDVSWPEAPKDPDPEDVPSLRTLEFRENAPASPEALAEAGAVFGFYAGEAKKPADFLAGVRKAVAAGLSTEEAVQALTLGAARIYGVDDRLGSLEVGKIANVVVFEDDPFAEDSKPKMVFIDGRKYEVP